MIVEAFSAITLADVSIVVGIIITVVTAFFGYRSLDLKTKAAAATIRAEMQAEKERELKMTALFREGEAKSQSNFRDQLADQVTSALQRIDAQDKHIAVLRLQSDEDRKFRKIAEKHFSECEEQLQELTLRQEKLRVVDKSPKS